jgi:fucose permease
MIVIQVGVETAVGGWVTTYYVQSGQAAWLGALATSGFFLTFTFGRIGLASIPDRWGYARTVQIASAVGVAGLLATFSAVAALAGFGLAGIALSLIFPTLLAWSARQHPEIRAQMASVSIAAAGAGGIIIPYAVGLGVSGFGATALPITLIALIVAMGLLALLEPQPKVALGHPAATDTPQAS